MPKNHRTMLKNSITALIGLLLLWGSISGATPGLVTHYQFEGDLADSVGGRDGTETGGSVSYEPGVNGGLAIRLPGVDDFRIEVAPFVPAPGTSFSVSGWIKVDSVEELFNPALAPQESFQYLYSAVTGDYYNGYTLIYENRDGEYGGATQFQGSTGLGTTINTRDSSGVTEAEWHMLSVSFDRSTAEYRLYIDGVKLATGSLPATNPTPARAFIGAYRYSSARNGNPQYASGAGLLDDIRLYDIALSDADVLGLYNETLAVGCSDECIELIAANTAAIEANTQSIGAATNVIADLADALAELQGAVTLIESSVLALETTVSGNATSAEAALSELQTTVTDLALRLGEVETSLKKSKKSKKSQKSKKSDKD